MTRSARQVATQLSLEPPPPYTEASSDVMLSRPAPSNVSSPPTETVPPGVELVQAPYELRRKNSSIFRDFLVFGGNPIDTSVPDVRLRTKNALLQSAVYINAQEWDRPVSIHASTKNSDLRLGTVSALVRFRGVWSKAKVLRVQHTLQADQAVRVRASTKNGRSRVFLPRDFKGVLAVSTKNGKCTLSADLRNVAVRIPSRHKETLKDDEMFGRRESSNRKECDVPNQLSNGVDVWYAINGDGPSAAIVDTKNGNVWAGFVGDDEVGCWPSCSVI